MLIKDGMIAFDVESCTNDLLIFEVNRKLT